MVKDKTILITGGAVRVGAMISKSLAKQNHLIIHYNHSKKEALKLAEQLGSQCSSIQLIQADLTQKKEIDQLFEKIKEKHQRLNILINSAAAFEEATFDQIKDWDLEIDLNLKAPLICAHKAKGLMPEGSSIINICDQSAIKPFEHFFLSSVSKGALAHASKALSKQLAPKIRVNALILGLALKTEGLSEERWQECLEKYSLLKREATSSELKSAIEFLITNEYVNGSLLSLDGGSF